MQFSHSLGASLTSARYVVTWPAICITAMILAATLSTSISQNQMGMVIETTLQQSVAQLASPVRSRDHDAGHVAGIDGAGATPQIQTLPTPPPTIKMTPSTPLNSPKRQEYDTTRRARFFHAFDLKGKDVGLAKLCQTLDFKLPLSTARRWIKERDIQGSLAFRRTRK